MKASETTRLTYLDVAKGIGIILVVAGHTFNGPIKNAIYIFHMPLFFILIGMTPKTLTANASSLIRRTRLYVASTISYIAIISLICITEMPGTHLLDRVKAGYGGGAFVVLWFIVTLIISSWGIYLFRNIDDFKKILISFFLLCTSYIFSYILHIRLPLGALVAFHAIPLMLFGEFIDRIMREKSDSWYFSLGIIVCIVGGFYPILDYNMKEGYYGVPFISLILAILASIAVVALSKILARVRFVERFFVFFGASSLAVMFIHQPIQIVARNRLPAPSDVQVFAVALLCVAAYLVVVSFAPETVRKLLAVRRFEIR